MENIEQRLVKAAEHLSRADIRWFLEEAMIAYEERRTQTDMKPGEARAAAIKAVLKRIEQYAHIDDS